MQVLIQGSACHMTGSFRDFTGARTRVCIQGKIFHIWKILGNSDRVARDRSVEIGLAQPFIIPHPRRFVNRKIGKNKKKSLVMLT